MPGGDEKLEFSSSEQVNFKGASMTSQEFVRHLRRIGVEIRANDGKLLVAGPTGAITPALQGEIRGRKAELLEVLRAHDASQEERCSPLTFAQQRLWLIDRFAPDTAAYNIPQSWAIEGAVDVEAFERALDRLTERHQALRTRIEIRDGEPVQVVMKRVKIPLQFTDLEEIAEAERVDRVKAWLVREGREVFALDHAPLIRFHIFRLASNRFVIAYNLHHIVADQRSLDVLKRDLAALYVESTSGADAGLAALTLQYSDVAERERSDVTAQRHARQLDYWRERLKGMPTLLELPFSKVRPGDQSYEGTTLTTTLDGVLTQKLRQLAARSQTSLYLLMLTAFAALLYRYTGQKDLCVGTPLTGRKLREEEDLIGLFVNMLPLRCTVEPEETFHQLLKRLSQTVPADFEHGEIPFQKLVTDLHPHRSLAYSPLFQVMFALNPKGTGTEDGQEETFIGVSKFDLTLQITERAQTLDAYFEYRTDLFAYADIEQFSRRLSRLLESIVENPETAVDSLALLTREDGDRFRAWNSTELVFDRNATLIDLLNESAQANPDALALCCGEAQYSFRELHERADFLAALLRAQGAGPGRFVALCLDRSVELIVSMLAVLKTGAAYLPLDPKYPGERLAYMLADSGARLLIAQRDDVAAELSVDDPELTVLYAAEALSEFAEEMTGRKDFSNVATPQDAAYLIYTSGSTGRPKGVVIEHRNVVALMAWAKSYFSPASLRGVLASTSVCFDLSVFEIFLPLSTGNTIVLVNDVLELPRSANADRVTLVNTVPSAMSALLEVSLPPAVRTVCMAGEFLPAELVDRVYAAGMERVFDLYGPTETTTYSTCCLRERGAAATIGRPICNTRIYLLDDNMRLVPPGALGEIFIGGEGVARGYLDRPELSQERFLSLPEIEPQGILYRTGDLARQLEDGSLVYLGRRDQQIKLRGHRIELGEIEAALRDASGISQVAVVVQELAGRDALVAFVAGGNAGTEDVKEWARELKKRLPTYMVPALIVPIAKMPLTPNGKTDRKALVSMCAPGMDRKDENDHASESPRDLLEQWLANIWAHRLGVPRVARDAHFFEDLGGYSLVAFEIFAEIEARLGVAMMLATLFQAPTVALLAAVIRRKGLKDSKRILMLAPAAASGDTNGVIYFAGSTSRTSLEAERLTGERVMAVGSEESASAVNDADLWAKEIALFEAARPPLTLVTNNANLEECAKLASNLTKAGFARVTLRSI
jgi:amino acid adenylation domain-containing protein